MIRTVDTLSSDGAQAGTPFEAELASPIRDADGTVLVAEGAKVYGRVLDAQGGGAVRKPRIAISLTSIEAPTKQIAIATSPAGAEGTGGGAAKKIGAGALIGAAAGSAAKGAAAGGAAALLTGNNQIVIRPGTLVEFILTQPAQVR